MGLASSFSCAIEVRIHSPPSSLWMQNEFHGTGQRRDDAAHQHRHKATTTEAAASG
jgi:hypothetical protein